MGITEKSLWENGEAGMFMASLVGDDRKCFRVVFAQGRLCGALKEGDFKRIAHHRSYVACIVVRVSKDVDGCVQSSALSRPSCTASSYSTDCAKKASSVDVPDGYEMAYHFHSGNRGG